MILQFGNELLQMIMLIVDTAAAAGGAAFNSSCLELSGYYPQLTWWSPSDSNNYTWRVMSTVQIELTQPYLALHLAVTG
jgi:hypothetical protein